MQALDLDGAPAVLIEPGGVVEQAFFYDWGWWVEPGRGTQILGRSDFSNFEFVHMYIRHFDFYDYYT